MPHLHHGATLSGNFGRLGLVNIGRLCLVSISRLGLVNTGRLCLVKYRPVNDNMDLYFVSPHTVSIETRDNVLNQ